MKRVVLSAMLVGCCFGTTVMAQGKLSKLKEKAMGAVAGTGGANSYYTNADIKQAAEDSSNTFLDEKAKSVAKDQYGFSGIYFANCIIGLNSDDQSKVYPVKKLLVEFNDKEKSISLKSRYAYESSDRSKFVAPAAFMINRDGYDMFSINKKTSAGKQFFESYNHVTNNSYNYLDFSVKQDLQGNYVQGDPFAATFANYAMQYAPGILVVFKGSGSMGLNSPTYLDENQLHSVVVLYQADKKDVASKITAREIFEWYQKMTPERSKLMDQQSSDSNVLPKKVAAAQAPSQQDMVNAVKKRMKDYGWKETLVYCYTTSEWLPRYELVGRDALNTLTGRTIAIVAVFKKTDGSCAFMNMTLEQLNNYGTPGNLKENYVTPPSDYANSGLEGISCDKSTTYKP